MTQLMVRIIRKKCNTVVARNITLDEATMAVVGQYSPKCTKLPPEFHEWLRLMLFKR